MRVINEISAELWEETRSLEPVVAATRNEADMLRRLPDAVADAFAERDVYRLLLPEDLGGRGLSPLCVFDLIEEVSTYDGSVGWNYAIGSHGGMMAGVMDEDFAREIFGDPGIATAGSGPPQGRAVATDGGYQVSGTFAWASGIHQAKWVMGGCFVFDGADMRKGANGIPVVRHVMIPASEVTILDRWKTGGMRGTGSTEFTAEDVFVPEQRAFAMFGAQPWHPSPIYRLPTSYFGFGLTAVPLGIARATIAALGDLAAKKAPPPPRQGLAHQSFTQYVMAKGEAMIEGARLGVRDAFERLWREVQDCGNASLESRARLRRASVHAVETSVEAVQQCYRAAGGTALFSDQPFERALRDVNAAAGHIVFQRAMMEDAGRVALGLGPLLPMF